MNYSVTEGEELRGISIREEPLVMPHPYVEHGSEWDFRSLYYGQPYPEVPTGRSDVGSERIRFAPVILRMVMTGGDPAEIRTASLLYVAHCVTYEMRLSTAESRILALAEGEQRSLDLGFATELMEEAEAILWGIALVGCLRAIGCAVSRTQDPAARKPFAVAARSAHAECGAQAGSASLGADNAHAHLSLAERIRPPENEPQRGHVVAGRRDLADLGFLHLCAAIARAYEERWNPFLQERLRRELAEHEPARAWVSTSQRDLHELGKDLLRAVREKYGGWQARYGALLEEGRHDIDAFFVAGWRDDSVADAEEPFLATMRQLREREPDLQLIV
jgi:hypothetical protein